MRRALERDDAPRRRQSPPRGCRLDPQRERIEAWLREDPKLTAKRIGACSSRARTGDPPAKQQAWKRYLDRKKQEGKPPLSREKWSKKYDVIRENARKGRLAEKRVTKSLPGTTENKGLKTEVLVYRGGSAETVGANRLMEVWGVRRRGPSATTGW